MRTHTDSCARRQERLLALVEAYGLPQPEESWSADGEVEASWKGSRLQICYIISEKMLVLSKFVDGKNSSLETTPDDTDGILAFVGDIF